MSTTLSDPAPYLSVVATSRNDNHGGDPLVRTQVFINTLARQCDKYRLQAELILVDWNPVPHAPGLAAVLTVPAEAQFLRARTVTVPSALHDLIKYSDQLPLFQMIAKNVGIRRARGSFVLATNIDIIFSNELIEFIAKQKLSFHHQYRVDRYDVESGLTADASLDDALAWAWSRPIRRHSRFEPREIVEHLYPSEEGFPQRCEPAPEYQRPGEVTCEEGIWQIRPRRNAPMSHLHTNACGDFTLMSREAWSRVGGYPEWEAFSFNIDSMGIIAAHYAGIEEVSLLPPCVCFHIEHSLGSGWSPDGEKILFERLDRVRILNPSWDVLAPLVEKMREEGRALPFNRDNWGMVGVDLPEQSVGDHSATAVRPSTKLAKTVGDLRVVALSPEYDLDRLSYWTEKSGKGAHPQPTRTTVYIPNVDGSYDEESSFSGKVLPQETANLAFRVTTYPSKGILRLDPCEGPGLVRIFSLEVVEETTGQVLWSLSSRTASEVSVGGTATLVRATCRHKADASAPLTLLSTGNDPNVFLPAVYSKCSSPLWLSCAIQLIPHSRT